jgi:hypothetical protein
VRRGGPFWPLHIPVPTLTDNFASAVDSKINTNHTEFKAKVVSTIGSYSAQVKKDYDGLILDGIVV